MFLGSPDLYAKKEKMPYSGYLILKLWMRNISLGNKFRQKIMVELEMSGQATC